MTMSCNIEANLSADLGMTCLSLESVPVDLKEQFAQTLFFAKTMWVAAHEYHFQSQSIDRMVGAAHMQFSFSYAEARVSQ